MNITVTDTDSNQYLRPLWYYCHQNIAVREFLNSTDDCLNPYDLKKNLLSCLQDTWFLTGSLFQLWPGNAKKNVMTLNLLHYNLISKSYQHYQNSLDQLVFFSLGKCCQSCHTWTWLSARSFPLKKEERNNKSNNFRSISISWNWPKWCTFIVSRDQSDQTSKQINWHRLNFFWYNFLKQQIISPKITNNAGYVCSNMCTSI